MDLKEFIKETLGQIIEAVDESRESFGENRIVPDNINHVGNSGGGVVKVAGVNKHLCIVKFEVGLTNEGTDSNKGGIGVMFGAINLKGGKQTEEIKKAITQISFSVPVAL